ncbi:MAG: cell division protein ZapA [Candidatus Omnitrophica bacterium]|nr:cell division protein ZapA [Candidatus Omnitrophota bacterium]MCM8806863.1 cell division protein ZapA [Candidatus Omnitrophota bacterium]
MFKVNILGKTYTIQTSLSSLEIDEIVKEINEKYKFLEKEYKAFDKVDLLVFYIIDLYERIYKLKKEIEMKEKNKSKVVRKIEEVERDIERLLKNLTEYV